MERVVERIKYVVQQYVSRELIDQLADVPELDDHPIIDWIGNSFVFMIRGHIWGYEHDPKIIEYPADWWQAFKQRWFPEWAQRRWPIKMTVVHITLRELYPGLKVDPNATLNWATRYEWSDEDYD